MLRTNDNAPFYILNLAIHTDFKIPFVSAQNQRIRNLEFHPILHPH